MALATEQGFPLWLAMGTIHHGWALAEQGHVEEGIEQLHQGLAALRGAGTGATRPYWLAQLAEAYRHAGQTQEGVAVVAEALVAVQATQERVWEAELYRLKGEFVLQSRVLNPEAEAEACFQQDIDVARHQQAKSWELRAATSLARLWQSQGQTNEAHALLAPVYGWFTEGFLVITFSVDIVTGDLGKRLSPFRVSQNMPL